MQTEIQSILDLPLGTLAVLAAGYIGYRLAYAGKDGGHKQTDTAFLTLVWASIAKLCATYSAVLGEISSYLIGFAVTVAAALLWRAMLQEIVFKLLRGLKLVDHDGFHSAWASVLGRKLKSPRQLVVRLKSGKRLMCHDLADFADAPLGPCLLGPDGSVGLYVTDVMESADGMWDERTPRSADKAHGWSMTFIAASEISEIEIMRPS